MIPFLGVVTVSDGVENHGGINKIPVEDSIDVALVHLVCTEQVLGQCGVVLKGLVKEMKDGDSLHFQPSCKRLSIELELMILSK